MYASMYVMCVNLQWHETWLCLATVLFNLFITCVLNHGLCDFTSGVYLRYGLEGLLFDLRQLNARTRTLERLIMEALFADYCILMAHPECELQTIVSKFAEASYLFGLKISLSKTKVMHQPALGSVATPLSINVDVT